MPHMRQQIRDYIATGLNNLSTTQTRVFVGRTRNLAADHEPTLLIYTRSEPQNARAVHGAPPTLERTVIVHIEGRVTAKTPPDDLLDQIASEVETGMAALIDYAGGIFLGGLVQNVQPGPTEMSVEASGDMHNGGIRLEYPVTYVTVEGVPNSAA